jgi:hypothetical protein
MIAIAIGYYDEVTRKVGRGANGRVGAGAVASGRSATRVHPDLGLAITLREESGCAGAQRSARFAKSEPGRHRGGRIAERERRVYELGRSGRGLFEQCRNRHRSLQHSLLQHSRNRHRSMQHRWMQLAGSAYRRVRVRPSQRLAKPQRLPPGRAIGMLGIEFGAVGPHRIPCTSERA